jgi:hypothetical protein
LRLVRAASASLGLAALQVFAERGGKPSLLLVLGCLAGHGISSVGFATWLFERGNAANSRHHG